MSISFQALRGFLAPLRRTPLHPQWLIMRKRSGLEVEFNSLTGRILDIGCAEKQVALALSDDCEYFGLDYYVTAHDVYRSRPDIYGDAAQLPVTDRSFGGVILTEVLEHLPDPKAALLEIARVLRPGGKLLLSVPFLYPIHDAPYDFHRFTRFALERMLRDSGFAIELMIPRERPLEVAGLMMSLALGDAARSILERHPIAIVALCPIGLLILLNNLFAWTLARLLPSSDFMPGGYEVVAVR